MESFSWKILWKIIKRTGRAAVERGEIPSAEALGQYRRDLLNNGPQYSASLSVSLLPFRSFSHFSPQSRVCWWANSSVFNLHDVHLNTNNRGRKLRETLENKDAVACCVRTDQNHGKIESRGEIQRELEYFGFRYKEIRFIPKIVSRNEKLVHQ